MSTTSNTQQTATQGISKVAEETTYGTTRARQEGDTLKNQTAPAYIDQAKQATADVQSQAKDTMSSAVATAETKWNEAKDTSSNVQAQAKGVLNSTADHTAARRDETKEKTSDASIQANQALDNFEHAASAKTNAAVDQGKVDVEQAKAQSTGYVQHALDVAQSYVHAGQARLQGGTTQSSENTAPTGRIMSTVQAAAGMALDTVDRSLNYAQSTLQSTSPSTSTNASGKPVAQSLQESVAPIAENVKQATATAISGAQQQMQYAKEHAPSSMEEAKVQGQKGIDTVYEKLPTATNPPMSSWEEKTTVDNRPGVAHTRPSEPSIEGAAQPYADTTKPIVDKPQESI